MTDETLPEDDPREVARARPLDLAVGMTKAFRPWLWGLAMVGAFVVVLLLGANRPANPTFVDAQPSSSASPTTRTSDFPERKIAVGASCLRVQVADTPERRAQGLKNRSDLGNFAGMLFQFDHTVSQTFFTMSEVSFPLTIGFYDEAGLRVDAEDMEPCSGSNSSCPKYGARAPFKVAVEVAKGKLPEGPLLMTCPS
jgi:uncharacterized membrane protein (UPF0127 family)